MVSSIALVLLALPIYWIYSLYSGLRKNIAAAKASNLPYIVIPVNVYAKWWLISSKFWMPYLRKLPSKWTESWIEFSEADWVWRCLYEPLKKTGDTFLTVSPTSIFCWMASPEAISQVCTRRDHFPKPLKDYKMLDIFGRNVVTTEGYVWKAHRKIISPTFNEKNNFMVFEETIQQTQQMLEKWTGPDGKGNCTLNEVPTDSMRLTLHIISKVGFGVRLLWPGTKQVNGADDCGLGSHIPRNGHKMNFSDALTILLDRLLLILVVPKAILKRLPWKVTKEAYEAHHEWGIYMKELFDQKVTEARKGEKDQGMDMMGTLVKSSYGDPLANSSKETKNDDAGKYVLSDAEIFGDAFVFIIAGHETTANSVHFSLMELAMVPACQRKLQADIQSIFGSTPPQEWNYESSITSMMSSMLGAVLNEELRLMPPVINIPKRCTEDSDQMITIDGKKCIIPRGSNISLNVVCVHRNPKFWPSLGPSKVTEATDDLNDFVPERWFVKHDKKLNPTINRDSENASDSEDLTFGGPSGRDTSAQLFHPPKGAYIPFSEGARSCLGKRFAQVEVVTALAVIFQKYSVELAVDEWASDEQVAKMSTEEKKELYGKAMKEARRKIRGAETIITLKLQSGFIPVRVMKKGEERFLGLFE